jgi:hypothetical protein
MKIKIWFGYLISVVGFFFEGRHHAIMDFALTIFSFLAFFDVDSKEFYLLFDDCILFFIFCYFCSGLIDG